MAFNTNIPDTNTLMFLDPKGPVGIARYDLVKYPVFKKLTRQQTSFFWQPDEIDCSKDAKDFKKLTPNEQHIFTSNIKRQIVLDSIQGRAPSAVLAPLASLPEVENWIQTWNYFETIHSQSYTHIIQSIYPDPTKVLDEVLSIEAVMKCADSISAPYDSLYHYNAGVERSGYQNLGSGVVETQRHHHKRLLWLALNSINALEGIRFYVSFACSWAFAELKKMEGNAKIIKFIARDENIHLASTQQMLKLLPKEDPDFAQIRDECAKEVLAMFIDVVEQEKDWARYLFAEGSMIGLNTQLLIEYLEWLANKRMTAIGLDSPYEGGSNPLPWTQKWIAGSDVRVAPQEAEVSSYIMGLKRNSGSSRLEGFKL